MNWTKINNSIHFEWLILLFLLLPYFWKLHASHKLNVYTVTFVQLAKSKAKQKKNKKKQTLNIIYKRTLCLRFWRITGNLDSFDYGVDNECAID